MNRGGALLRVGITCVAVAAALAIGWQLWIYYTLSPWTRDARVLANVIEIAPDVSGLVSAVNVADNQLVHKGDVLFVIDQQRFKVAAEQARAQVALKVQALKYAQDTANRDTSLVRDDSEAISVQTVERTSVSAAEAEAELQAAQAALDTAELNLTRSEVRAPVEGYVTNLNVFVGNYTTVGKGAMALVDRNSFYVYAYFMETKLPAIRDGDPARVELMAGGVVIDGVVEGLSRAIANTTDQSGLLANVNPEFDWIRLAQRIPVRIKLGPLPSGVELAAGMSATVIVTPRR
ncbi:efflux RND transporter periplasmic adaptor subunit [Ancylobacter sp. MQZ15Z-1]|uniref:Efflux RND transporter periplasmic adaptor subunit n=1 Tax=Ancylobacter mangrovi TaxID=2972472 RepID=A0A9X2T567_9HYPH|nr:efflux RND transporter periplasmic adaptor subunit [Ancylobacter mangrovi]MCS0496956.1 efflux RND transporter periplasmic adaptor subunit [Ancylobacter mangrovi]